MHAQGSAEAVERGRALYNEYCLICHGHEMVSTGAVFDLRRFPKDARERFTRSVTDGKPPGMPAWKGQVNERELELLWAFVLSGGDPNRPATGGR